MVSVFVLPSDIGDCEWCFAQDHSTFDHEMREWRRVSPALARRIIEIGEELEQHYAITRHAFPSWGFAVRD